MAMGTKRGREQQEELFYASEQAEAPGHPFYGQLNRVLEEAQFDAFCESSCRPFYHVKLGRPSLAPGVAATAEAVSCICSGAFSPIPMAITCFCVARKLSAFVPWRRARH